MKSTALILRNKDAPPPHVLEVDGPRHKFRDRGDPDYYLATDNLPRIGYFLETIHDVDNDPRLVGTYDAYWEIVENFSGRVEIFACRPNDFEVADGDLLGAQGSIITLISPSRLALRNGLRLARRLLKADPMKGFKVTSRELIGISRVETDLIFHIYNS